MKLSVIVPVYNTSKYLRKCLDSILNQTLDDIEIIVVNDGSVDDSEKIIIEYKKKYKSKIVNINKKNGGQGSARNIGIKCAKGDYIGFVDSDDFIHKDMYKKMYDIAVKNDSDIVICGINNYYEKSKITNKVNLNLKEDAKINEAIIESVPSVVNKIYKRDLLLDNNIFFDENIWYEDFPYSIQMVMNSKKINFIDEPFYNYFHRIKSTMHNENISKNLDILKAYDILINYSKENNFYDKYSEELNYLLLKEIYIATINRIVRTNNDYKEKKKYIKIIKDYCKGYNLKNKYFKSLPKTHKISYYLIRFNLYKCLHLIFKIREARR